MPPSVSASLKERINDKFETTGYVVGRDVSDADLRDSIAALDQFSQPLSENELAVLLAEMYTDTKQRKEQQLTLNIATKSFFNKLKVLPGDAVRAALKGWSEKETWWPSWKELKDEINANDKAGMIRQAVFAEIDRRKGWGPRRQGQKHVGALIRDLPKDDKDKFFCDLHAKFPSAFGERKP